MLFIFVVRMCTSNFVFLILFRILIYWNKVKCSHGLFTKIIWKESQKYHDTLCWRYMWTRWKCKKVWLKQVSVLQWKLTYTISEYVHMIVQQCAYRTTILIKLSFSWKCLAKCIMDKGVLPGILVCSEIFRGGMCISGGNANTIHNINLFSSNPHNNYSIDEKKNEQWKIKSYQLLTYTCIMIKKYIEKVALWRKMIFFTV